MFGEDQNLEGTESLRLRVKDADDAQSDLDLELSLSMVELKHTHGKEAWFPLVDRTCAAALSPLLSRPFGPQLQLCRPT